MNEDDKSSIYNIHLCRICQNPKKLDLIETSDISGSEDGKSCWETLKYIFCEIIWVEDRLLSLICKMCIKNIYEIAQFKKLCLETNMKRDKFNNVYIELVNEPINNVTDNIKDKEPAQIEEVILPHAPMFIKAEIIDDVDVLTIPEHFINEKLTVVKAREITKTIENESTSKGDAIKASQGKRPIEDTLSVSSEKVKKLRKDSSASVPNNVTIISSKLSEYLPFQNPRNNETMCKICQGLFSTTNDLRDHIMSHHGMIPRDDNDSSDEATEFEESPNITSTAMLPEKSKKRYETIYSEFKKWCEEKNSYEVTEDVIMTYFMERSEKLKSPTSLWSDYSMLKQTLLIYDQIDISTYPSLKPFLKMKNMGYRPKKSRVFTKEDIDRFFTDAPDDKYLLLKVALIVGIAGACHKHELCRLTVDDIEDEDHKVIIRIRDARGSVQRMFTIADSEEDEASCLKIFRKYATLRPKDTEHRRFFMRYQVGKCINQVIGTNTFSKIPSQVAKFLNLDNAKDFTGRYRCEYCHIGFYTLDEFQCHYKEANHKNFLPLQCPKCGCKTIRRADQNVSAMRCHCPFSQIDETLEKKKSVDDRNRKILCMHCNSCFATLRLAKEHVAREHVAIRPFNCSKCNGSFLSRKLLDEHNIANHHVRCNLCPQSFDSMELWQKHRRQDHDQFPSNNLISKPINQPQGFHCILCKRMFPTRFRLANHIESQECQQYGTCILCGTTFHGSNITRHLEMNHNIDPHDNNFAKYFKCKTSTPSTNKEQTNEPRRQCEQYRECNLCAKYLHVSQIRTHLIYTHHVNVYERGFKLRPFFKNKVQPEVNGVQNVRLYTRNRRHEEHTYSRKLLEDLS